MLGRDSLGAVAPGAQEQAVGQVRVLPEARHQLKADQIALLRGDWRCRLARHGGSLSRQELARRSIAHRGGQCYSHGRRRSVNATSNAGPAAARAQGRIGVIRPAPAGDDPAGRLPFLGDSRATRYAVRLRLLCGRNVVPRMRDAGPGCGCAVTL